MTVVMCLLQQQGQQGQRIDTRGPGRRSCLADVEIKLIAFFLAREFDGFPHAFSLCGVQGKLTFLFVTFWPHCFCIVLFCTYTLKFWLHRILH